MEYTSTKSAPWKLLDRLREDKLSGQDIGVALAALIYLRWADFQESEEEAFAAFEGEAYKPILPASLHWRTWHMSSPKEVQGIFAQKLPRILEELNNSSHSSLATHLHRISSGVRLLGQLSPSSLDVMMRWLADQPFETQNDRRGLLDVFDTLLQKIQENSKYSGEFRTPTSISQLIIAIAAPKAGERIYDPCFGLAGFLTAAYDYVKENNNGFNRNGDSLVKIAGVEINLNIYLIGLTRLALAGIDHPQLELGNSLERLPFSNSQRDGFDLAILNPPWGGRQKQAGLDHFPVRTSDSTGLFVQHALGQLRPQGRAVIIVPEGFLFRSGAEQRLRRMLLEQHTVEAVVSLPTAVFMPYTGIKASILVLSRDGQTERVRMFDAETYFDKGKGRQPATISDAMSLKLAKDLRAMQPVENSWDVDVATLAEVEWDFSPRRRDKGGLSGVLDSLRAKVEVLLLKECCNIVTGRAVKSTDLVDKIVDKNLIPYVRIKDVERGQATKGSSWLSPEATSSVDASWKLRAGDVLLSKSGTIGKTGVVRNGAVGAVAANGFIVIRPDQNRIDPHYLQAYFDSSECKAWLETKARGATIQHLSRNVIEELPIPVPPMQIQQRIAKQCRENNEDAIALLSKIITGDESDPLSTWLDRFVSLLPRVDINGRGAITMLDQMARHVGYQYNTSIGEKRNLQLAEWFDLLAEAIRPFKDCAVPPGPSLFSIEMESARGLDRALKALKGQSLSENNARSLTKYLTEWVDAAKAHLLNDINIVLGVDKGSPHDIGLVNIPLLIHNGGVLPLLNVKITTSPDLGHGEFNYLAENAKVTVNLKLLAKYATEQVFTFVASWSGVTLDGQSVNGSRELAFDVREAISVSAEPVADLGGSPYVCGDPVKPDRNDVFFGRDELLDQIRRQIMLSGNVVLLEGNRRAGKSSILRHLEGMQAVPGWLGVYCSLQGTEGSREGVGVPTVEVFRGMAISIATSLQRLGTETPLPDGTVLPSGQRLGIVDACIAGIKELSPFSYFREYIEVVLERLAQDKLGLLLMLDEFDKLQEGIDRGITSPQVPENIRFLVQTYPQFSAILTGSRRLKRLREEYWSALFGLGTRFGVTSLPEDSARNLVTEPVKGRLTYSREAVDRATTLTDRQPYLLQCLCNRVFDMASQLKTRSITLDVVERAGDALVEDNEHFASLWDYAGTDRRRFILALCQREMNSPDPFSLGIIRERLLSYGIDVDDERIIADLEFLQELEIVDRIGESYGLSIPLMGTWIDRQQDFAALKSKARSETEDLHE